MNNIIKGKQKLAILFLSFFFVCLCFHLTYYNARCLAKIKNFLSTYYTIPEKHLKKQRVVDEFPDHFECAPKINPWWFIKQVFLSFFNYIKKRRSVFYLNCDRFASWSFWKENNSFVREFCFSDDRDFWLLCNDSPSLPPLPPDENGTIPPTKKKPRFHFKMKKKKNYSFLSLCVCVCVCVCVVCIKKTHTARAFM